MQHLTTLWKAQGLRCKPSQFEERSGAARVHPRGCRPRPRPTRGGRCSRVEGIASSMSDLGRGGLTKAREVATSPGPFVAGYLPTVR